MPLLEIVMEKPWTYPWNKEFCTENQKGRKLSFERRRLKIFLKIEATIFNQGVVLKEVNLATKVIPSLKKLEWKLCSSHGIMKVKKPGMVVFGVLEEKSIEPCLLVVPVCIGKVVVLEWCTEVYRKRNWFVEGLFPVWMMDDVVDNACRVCRFRVVWM